MTESGVQKAFTDNEETLRRLEQDWRAMSAFVEWINRSDEFPLTLRVKALCVLERRVWPETQLQMMPNMKLPHERELKLLASWCGVNGTTVEVYDGPNDPTACRHTIRATLNGVDYFCDTCGEPV